MKEKDWLHSGVRLSSVLCVMVCELCVYLGSVCVCASHVCVYGVRESVRACMTSGCVSEHAMCVCVCE